MALTLERLKEVVSYDPETGIFHRLMRGEDKLRHPIPYKRSPSYPYVVIAIDGVLYRAHRLAVLYMTGVMPEHEVDHDNGIEDDNRWINLKPCTEAENMQNKKKYRNNSSGYTGVSYHKVNKNWIARIFKNGKCIRLGSFSSPELAAEAYAKAKAEFHDFHPEVVQR